jgi:hypothetical protein
MSHLNPKIRKLIIGLETHIQAYREEASGTQLVRHGLVTSQRLLGRINEFSYEGPVSQVQLIALRQASRWLIEEGVRDVPDFSKESPERR